MRQVRHVGNQQLGRRLFATAAIRAPHVDAVPFALRVFAEVVAPLLARQQARAADPAVRRVMGVWRDAVVREHAVPVAVVAVVAAVAQLHAARAHMHGVEPLFALVALVRHW